MEAIDLLQAITGFSDAQGAEKSANRPALLGRVDPAYTSGSPRVTFDGESTMSTKAYPFVRSYVPVAGDRVLLVPVGTTYLIVGAISTGTGDGVPSGSVQMFAGATAPSGWLLCNGQAVSRTTYARLFAAIGTTWGTGNGSSTFNVPDMRGRAPLGAGTGTGLTARTLGAKGGAEAHTLTEAQLAAHDHPFSGDSHSHGFSGDSHDHSFTGNQHRHTGQTDAPTGVAVYVNSADGSTSSTVDLGAADGRWSDTLDGTGVNSLKYHEHPFTTGYTTASGTVGSASTGGSVGSASTDGTVGSAGGGDSVDHMPPFAAVNYIIKF